MIAMYFKINVALLLAMLNGSIIYLKLLITEEIYDIVP